MLGAARGATRLPATPALGQAPSTPPRTTDEASTAKADVARCLGPCHTGPSCRVNGPSLTACHPLSPPPAPPPAGGLGIGAGHTEPRGPRECDAVPSLPGLCPPGSSAGASREDGCPRPLPGWEDTKEEGSPQSHAPGATRGADRRGGASAVQGRLVSVPSALCRPHAGPWGCGGASQSHM